MNHIALGFNDTRPRPWSTARRAGARMQSNKATCGNGGDMSRSIIGATLAATCAALSVMIPTTAGAQARGQRQVAEPPAPLGALAPANLAKSRPKPPFDLTGT